MLTTILFDFGGVIAEEGFHAGLLAIGKRNGLDPDRFFADVDRIIFDCGYLVGRADESAFWDAVRRETGIAGSNNDLREDILQRFTLRPEMLAAVDRIRQNGLSVAMLSDQTNWLEELDSRDPFMDRFDRVFNSYRIHLSKRDPSVFSFVGKELGKRPEELLFVDDNAGHVQRAASQGLQTLHFTTTGAFERTLESVPGKRS